MLVDIEHESLRGLALTEKQALIDLAVGLFTEKRITLGKAAQIAKLTQLDFQRELASRGIPIHYDPQDLRQDLETLDRLKDK